MEKLKEIIKNAKKISEDAREVQEQADGKVVLDPDITGSVLSTVFNTIKDICKHERLE